MAEEKIEVGDIVYLKSGSPAMTVYLIDDNYINCVWFDKGQDRVPKYTGFVPKSLTKENPGF
jgi:uncharacterized protein YodC (DUF2158 family)